MRGYDAIDHEALEGKRVLIAMLLVIGALAAMMPPGREHLCG